MLCYPVCPDFRAGGTKIGAFKRGFCCGEAAAKPPWWVKNFLMTTCSCTQNPFMDDTLKNLTVK